MNESEVLFLAFIHVLKSSHIPDQNQKRVETIYFVTSKPHLPVSVSDESLRPINFEALQHQHLHLPSP